MGAGNRSSQSLVCNLDDNFVNKPGGDQRSMGIFREKDGQLPGMDVNPGFGTVCIELKILVCIIIIDRSGTVCPCFPPHRFHPIENDLNIDIFIVNFQLRLFFGATIGAHDNGVNMIAINFMTTIRQLGNIGSRKKFCNFRKKRID